MTPKIRALLEDVAGVVIPDVEIGAHRLADFRVRAALPNPVSVAQQFWWKHHAAVIDRATEAKP